jgi:uncharacterized membrane protein YhaH (DUF805 family)
MAININKAEQDFNYFYTSDDNQYGPFNLVQLIPKISGDTLVWRDGIEWTNANKLDELKKFFSEDIIEEKRFQSKSNTYEYNYIKPKMFDAPFSFDGRIRRTEYGISMIIYVVAYAITLGLVKASSVFVIAYIPTLWFLWAQGAKRCHDRGNPGWYQLIPFYALWMLFAEGDMSENEYGNSPK